MKSFRPLLLALGGLLFLLLLAAGALYALFDAEQVKTQLAEQVRTATRRDLSIDGELQLSLWPDVGLRLGRMRLSEKDSATTFAAVDSARLAVAIWPLFNRKIAIRQIAIDGLSLNLRQDKDGHLNIDDLTGDDESAADKKNNAALQFDIAGIELRHARLSWEDAASRKTTTLSDFNLSSGQLLADPAASRFHVEKLALGTIGQHNSDRFELALRIPLLDIDGSRLSGEDVELTAKLAGHQRSFDAHLGLGGFGGTTQALRIARIAIEVAAQADRTSLKAQLISPLTGDGEKRTVALEKITGLVEIAGPKLPTRQLRLPLNGHLQADLRRHTAALALDTALDQAKVGFTLGLDKLSPLALHFGLDAERLDIDKYLPPTAAPGARAASADGPGQATPIDLGMLNGLDLQGQINIGQLQVRKIRLDNLAASLLVRAGRLDIAPLSADIYGGTLNGRLSAAADGNRFALQQKLTDIAIQPLLKDVLGKEPLTGRGALNLDLNSQGATVAALKQALAGRAALSLKDGAVNGIDLARLLRQLSAAFGSPQAAGTTPAEAGAQTDFSSLAASFKIAGGVAHDDDLDIKSPLFRVRGAGDIDLANNRLDYLAKISLANNLTGQDGKDLARLRGVTVPLRLRGPFAEIGYTPELESLARDIVRNKAKAAVKGQLKGRLKELFGR